MIRSVSILVAIALLLWMPAERLRAQSALDRREANQLILLEDSDSPTLNVFALRFVSDGTDGFRLLAAGEGKVVWQWKVRQDTKSGSVSLEPLSRIRWPINRGQRGTISSIASGRAHAGGAPLAAVCGFGLLPTMTQVQNLEDNQVLASLYNDELTFAQNIAYSCEFWPEPSSLLAVGCGAVQPTRAMILIWDIKQPARPRAVLETGFDAVRLLSVSPDGRSLVASDGVGQRVRRWTFRDLETVQTDTPVDFAVPSTVMGFAWQNENHCLVATRRHGLRPLDEEATDASLVSLLFRNRTRRPLTVATRKNGQNLKTWDVMSESSQPAIASATQQIAIRDGTKDWQTFELDLRASPHWEFDVDLDTNGRLRVMAFTGVKLFAQSNGVALSLKGGLNLDQSPPDYSKFRSRLDIGLVDDKRRLLARLQDAMSTETATAVAVSPDGRFVAAVGEQLRSSASGFGNQPIQEVRVWRVSDGSLVATAPDRRTVSSNLSPIRSVGLSRSQANSTVPDVIRFSWSSDDRLSLSLSDSLSRNVISRQPANPVKLQINSEAQSWKARFDRDRYWLTKQSSDGQEVGPFPVLDWLSPDILDSHRFERHDRKYMAIGYRDAILIWDLARLKSLASDSARRQEQALVRCFYRHAGQLSDLSVSEEGDYLISGADDGSICLWSLRGIEQPYDGIRELGLSLRRDGNSVLVENVTQGLPAFFAGLAQNDELVKLRVPRPGSSESEWIERTDQMESALRALPPGLGAIIQVRGRPGMLVADLTHEPLWTLYPMLDGQWVMSTPAQVLGASSDEAMRRFGWHINLGGKSDQSVALFPLDLFRSTHERIAVIAQTSWKNQQPVVRPLSLDLPSRVEITEVQAADGSRVSLTDEIAMPVDLNVTLSVQRSGKETPKQLELWCNGQLIRHLALEPSAAELPLIRWPVPKSALRIGDRNQLIAVVRSDSTTKTPAGKESPTALVNRSSRMISVAGSPKPKMHFLGVGVTDLDHAAQFQQKYAGMKPLRFSANDVCLLGHALAERTQESGFEIGEFRYLVSRVPEGIEIPATQVAPPTHKEVLKALDQLREVALPEDFVCVSLSCHGFAADDGANLVMQDTAPDSPNALTDRDLFDGRLWKLRCSALVLLDACHSGSALTSDSLRGLNGFGLGPEILVSCKPRQESFEAERLHRKGDHWFGMSVFTASLLEALNGRELSGSSMTDREMKSVVYAPSIDRNGDGFLSVEELGLHATLRVPVLQKLTNPEAATLDSPQQPDLLPSLAFPRSRIRLRIPTGQ